MVKKDNTGLMFFGLLGIILLVVFGPNLGLFATINLENDFVATKDTTVMQAYPNQVYSTDTDLEVEGTYQSTKAESYIEFDIPNMPENFDITSAILKIHLRRNFQGDNDPSEEYNYVNINCPLGTNDAQEAEINSITWDLDPYYRYGNLNNHVYFPTASDNEWSYVSINEYYIEQAIKKNQEFLSQSKVQIHIEYGSGSLTNMFFHSIEGGFPAELQLQYTVETALPQVCIDALILTDAECITYLDQNLATLDMTLDEKIAQIDSLNADILVKVGIIQTLTDERDQQLIRIAELETGVEDNLIIISELELNLSEQAAYISYLEDEYGTQLEVISGLEADIAYQKSLVTQLNLTLEQERLYLAELEQRVLEQEGQIQQFELTIAEQLLQLSQLNLTVEQQAAKIIEFDLTIAQQASYIALLNDSIETQAGLINNLSSNLETKILLVDQLNASNIRQAELIAEMESEFALQGEIVAQLNNTIQDDAEIIQALSHENTEQGEIIAGMELTTQQQAELIAEMTALNSEQATIISAMKLTNEEQAALIDELNLNLESQGLLIAELQNTLEEKLLIIEELKSINEEQKALLSSDVQNKLAEKEEEARNLKIIIVVMGFVIVGGLFLYTGKK